MPDAVSSTKPVPSNPAVLRDLECRLEIADQFRLDAMNIMGIDPGSTNGWVLTKLEDSLQPDADLRSDVSSLTDLLSRAEEENETLRTRLDNALHAAYRLASVACDISGADMQAVQRAADKCGCDHEDSPEPHNPRREWREG